MIQDIIVLYYLGQVMIQDINCILLSRSGHDTGYYCIILSGQVMIQDIRDKDWM